MSIYAESLTLNPARAHTANAHRTPATTPMSYLRPPLVQKADRCPWRLAVELAAVIAGAEHSAA